MRVYTGKLAESAQPSLSATERSAGVPEAAAPSVLSAVGSARGVAGYALGPAAGRLIHRHSGVNLPGTGVDAAPEVLELAAADFERI